MSKWLSAREGFGGLARAYETAARDSQVCAERFMERILELGGVPVQDLQVGRGPYHRQPDTLSTGNPAAVRRELQDSLTECEKALRHYTRLADQTLGSDHITHKLAVSALETAVRLRRSLRGHLS
jgi:ferritin-like protein